MPSPFQFPKEAFFAFPWHNKTYTRFRTTGPAECKEEEGHVVGIKSVFEQLNRREEAKEKLEKLNLERQQLIDEVNAPLKRKTNIVQAEMPNPKRARNEPSEKKSKPKLQKPKLEQSKPAPKYKQPKMSDFFKKI